MRPRRGKQLSEDQVRLLARLHRRGWSQRDVAERVGCTQSCVMRWLRRLGLSPNGHRTRRSLAKKRRSYWRTCRANGLESLQEAKQINRAIRSLSAWKRRCEVEVDALC